MYTRINCLMCEKTFLSQNKEATLCSTCINLSGPLIWTNSVPYSFLLHGSLFYFDYERGITSPLPLDTFIMPEADANIDILFPELGLFMLRHRGLWSNIKKRLWLSIETNQIVADLSTLIELKGLLQTIPSSPPKSHSPNITPRTLRDRENKCIICEDSIPYNTKDFCRNCNLLQ